MTWSVQEVRVAEGDVSRPAFPNLDTDILQHNLTGHYEEAATIHRRNRTMAAGMQTPSAGFHIASRHHPSLVYQMGIMLVRRQCLSSRLGKGQPL